MIEIILLIFLAIKIGRLAESKGLRAGQWRLRLVLFWLAGEVVGTYIGLMIFGKDNIFSVMLVAVAFGLSSYFILNNYLNKFPDSPDRDIDRGF